MPGPKPRLHLPYADWPADDRLLWERGFSQDDSFADIRLAKASRDGCMWSWRRFLGFITNNEPEALEIAAAERLTLGRVKAFVAHLATTNALNSVAAVIERLYTAARVMMPDRNWHWLRAIKLRLHAAVPAHSSGGPEITSVPLLDLGLKLLEDNKPRPGAKLGVRQAVAYRDGLMLGFVAYVPLRPKNLASIEIGRHLVLVHDRWFVVIPREETKTKKPIQFQIPKILVPYLVSYLDIVRPAVLRGRKHHALWVSPKGGALSYVGICKSLARLSGSLGVRFSPHDARDAAVNTWAIARPDQICVARDLLYHSKLDTTGLYNRVRGIEASRAYRKLIREIRKKKSHQRECRYDPE
jgi:integrase/recombinase XerD